MNEHPLSNQDFLTYLSGLITEHLADQNFGAKELAQLAGISQRRLCGKLRTIVNKSASLYIRESRLKKALEILKRDDVPVAEVAYKVGFGSATYFNKCFHEFFGWPPGKIRNGEYDYLKSSSPHKKLSEAFTGKKFMRTSINLAEFLLTVLILLIFVYLLIIQKSSGINLVLTEKEPEISLAVLPFRNLSDSVAIQYFLDGLRDEIFTYLCKIQNLRITSRISVDKFRGESASASEMGKKLHVRFVVTGSGQKYNNYYLLRVQLTEVRRDKQLWAASYKKDIRETKDIYKIQNQIATSIASELNATIKPEDKKEAKDPL